MIGRRRDVVIFGTSPEGGGLVVTSSDTSFGPLFRVAFDPGRFDIGGTKTLTSAQLVSTRMQALQTPTRWNAIEGQVTMLLTNASKLPEVPLVANDPKVLGVLVGIWRKLPPDDPRNVDFDKAAALLRLPEAQRRLFKSAGATNLPGVATVLHVAPQVERENAEVERIRRIFRNRKIEGPPPEPVKFAVTSRDSAAILATIGSGLGGGRD